MVGKSHLFTWMMSTAMEMKNTLAQCSNSGIGIHNCCEGRDEAGVSKTCYCLVHLVM